MGYKGKQGKNSKNQEADVSAKRIFGNNILCAQFLRNYAGLPMLACVQAEDIEDITERYHLFKEVEFQSDTVKKVHVRGQENGEENDIYILSLIEHKSSVDYDVTMQILKYMVCIWENEAAEAKRTTMTSDKKDFRYLPIYPIVYYEGSGEWTAAESLKDRVLMGDLFKAYIPDFTYKLVRTQDYSKEELLSKEDAISLLMLLNKIQQAKDFEELSGLPTKKLNDILQRAPVDVAEIIVSVVRSLCRRLNLTEEETTNLMKEMEAGNMGFLWENMEKMDIQLERRNTEEAKQEAEEAKQKAAEARQEAAIQKQKAEEAEKNIHDLCCALIAVYQNQGIDREAAKKQLMRTAGLKEEIMDELFESLWHQ